MKKVLIADDHSLFSLGLSSLLKNIRGFEVVGWAEDGLSVIYNVIQHAPDILILDLNMPRKNGIEILKEVKEYKNNIYVLVMTMYNDADLIDEVRKSGGNAYFLKNSDEKELLEILKTQPADFYISETILKTSLTEREQMDDGFSSLVKLTVREKEILKLIVEGSSSRQIGIMLQISSSTVDTHRKNMLKKLSFNKISELVSYAHKNNLV
ncbi:MAG: response regulator transcription factor [Cyclobacteriaceae bacterium]|nr:response regulator transcription factor [Cyclobacteriaceae bacterium]